MSTRRVVTRRPVIEVVTQDIIDYAAATKIEKGMCLETIGISEGGLMWCQPADSESDNDFVGIACGDAQVYNRGEAVVYQTITYEDATDEECAAIGVLTDDTPGPNTGE